MPYRSRKWMGHVASLESCVLCGAFGVQVAHRNEGKGLSQKASDALTAALCPSCHHEIDNDKTLEREFRRQLMDRAIVRTLERLVDQGLVVPK